MQPSPLTLLTLAVVAYLVDRAIVKARRQRTTSVGEERETYTAPMTLGGLGQKQVLASRAAEANPGAFKEYALAFSSVVPLGY